MINNTNYIGMEFGRFKVIGHRKNNNSNEVELKLRCGSCGTVRLNKLVYRKIIRVKCKACGRLDIIIPVSYYEKTNMVKDTISMGAYEYRKVRAEYKLKGIGVSELDYILKIKGLVAEGDSDKK